MRSPFFSASSRRFRANKEIPSPISVPSDLSEKGRQSPVSEKAGVLLKHMYMKMSFRVSAPPTIDKSACPSSSSLIAIAKAESELAQAASVTQLVPPKLKRLAIRPATTFPNKPGKVLSCQGT